jgi:site-specific DNA-methyltransferase (cytosine-N4-specific)
LPTGKVNLVGTSPPYALHFKKEYGNKSKKEYVEWFLPFAAEIHRILAEDGSFVLNIDGSYNPGY